MRKDKAHNSPVNVHPALRVMFVKWMSLSALLSLAEMAVPVPKGLVLLTTALAVKDGEE